MGTPTENMVTCAGCGKRRRAGYYAREAIDIEVAIGKRVVVCAGKAKGASAECVRRARENVCPGCGEQNGYVQHVTHAAVCEKCRATFAKGAAEESKPPNEVRRWALIDASRFLGYLRGNDSDSRREIARLLAETTGGRTMRAEGEESDAHGYVPPCDRRSGDFRDPRPDARCEVTAAQYEALCALATRLGDWIKAARAEGFADGENLLGKLATGEVSIAKYDDEAAKRRPARRDEEEVGE